MPCRQKFTKTPLYNYIFKGVVPRSQSLDSAHEAPPSSNVAASRCRAKMAGQVGWGLLLPFLVCTLPPVRKKWCAAAPPLHRDSPLDHQLRPSPLDSDPRSIATNMEESRAHWWFRALARFPSCWRRWLGGANVFFLVYIFSQRASKYLVTVKSQKFRLFFDRDNSNKI
jgi:hypothetical protein